MSAVVFTAQQREAIERRSGPLLLAANAGSGKTSVLVERYVAMVMEDEIAPGSILAVTFTDRAAGEMRDRIRRRLIEKGGHEHVAAAEAAWISTLHGFCNRVLRQHAIAAGIDPAFRQLDDGEARELRQRSFRAALADFMAGGDDHVELVAAFGPDQIQTEIEAVYDLLRTRGEREPRLPEPGAHPPASTDRLRAAAGVAIEHVVGLKPGPTHAKALAFAEQVRDLLAAGEGVANLKPQKPGTNDLKAGPYAEFFEAFCQYVTECCDEAGAAAVVLLDDLLGRFGARYEVAKRDAGAIDYSDLELLTRDLFVANAGLRDSYRDRFERVMVDEFQDVNPLQLELLGMLDRGQTFVVGDEFQSIYGFRHADVEVFRVRRAELGAVGAALVLPDNFRSHPDLLAAVNSAFASRFGDGYTPLAHGQTERPRAEPRIELLLTDTDWLLDDDHDERDLGWRGQEARLVAARVAALIEGGAYRPREIAVLLRAATDMHVFERALELRGIPTLASGGKGFWARRQIRDLLAFIASVANPRDETEFFALLASPLAGISSTGLVQIADAAGPGRRWDAIARGDEALAALSPADAERLAAFKDWFGALRSRAAQLPIDALLDHAITTLGYDVHVLSLPAGRRRLANLFKLQRLATRFEAAHGRDLRGFVDRARAELEADAREPEAPIELGEADAVQLMTMHAAKGLEFPVVVCADLGRRPQSRRGRILVEGDRIGLRLPAVRGDAVDTLEYAALNGEARARDQAEEDRVLYVALTRAEELLIVSGGEKLAKWPEVKPGCTPIRWLAPALVPGLEPLDNDDGEVVAGRGGGRIAVVALTGDTADELLSIPGEDPQSALRINEFAAPAPASLQEPQRPAQGVPDRISYSSLTDYGKCGYRYYLRRVLRLAEVDPGELAAGLVQTPSGLDPRVRGSIVHELLEDLDFETLAPPEPAAVRALADLYDVEIDEAGIADCLALVAAFADGPLVAALRSATSIRRERGFAFSLSVPSGPTPLVNGLVDVIAELPDGASIVIDYKTDELEPGEDLETKVAAEYPVQRAIYALAALRSGATSAEVTHLFLNRPSEPATASYDRTDIETLEQVVRDRAAGLLAGDFSPTDTPHRSLCATCPGRALLCSWGPEMTERELH